MADTGFPRAVLARHVAVHEVQVERAVVVQVAELRAPTPTPEVDAEVKKTTEATGGWELALAADPVAITPIHARELMVECRFDDIAQSARSRKSVRELIGHGV